MLDPRFVLDEDLPPASQPPVVPLPPSAPAPEDLALLAA